MVIIDRLKLQRALTRRLNWSLVQTFRQLMCAHPCRAEIEVPSVENPEFSSFKDFMLGLLPKNLLLYFLLS